MNATTIGQLLPADKVQAMEIPANTNLYQPGDVCNNFVFVETGRVRVEMLAQNGQQLMLYRIQAGESCVLTTSCLLGGDPYSVQATAETDLKINLVAKSEFSAALNQSENFRQFVFNGFCARLTDVIARMNELAATTVDQRLASVLVERYETSGAESTIQLTHENIAIEVGTAREVVSRRLAAFEKQGFLTRQRGEIQIRDIDGLKQQIEHTDH